MLLLRNPPAPGSFVPGSRWGRQPAPSRKQTRPAPNLWICPPMPGKGVWWRPPPPCQSNENRGPSGRSSQASQRSPIGAFAPLESMVAQDPMRSQGADGGVVCKPVRRVRNGKKILCLTAAYPCSRCHGYRHGPENQNDPSLVSLLSSVRIGPRWFRMKQNKGPGIGDRPAPASGCPKMVPQDCPFQELTEHVVW
jgi:hypothetical protein